MKNLNDMFLIILICSFILSISQINCVKVNNIFSPVYGTDSYTYSDNYEDFEKPINEVNSKKTEIKIDKQYQKPKYIVNTNSESNLSYASDSNIKKRLITNGHLINDSNSLSSSSKTEAGILTNVIIGDLDNHSKKEMYDELKELETQAYKKLIFTEIPKNKNIDKNDPLPYYDKFNLKQKELEILRDKIISLRRKLNLPEVINFYVMIGKKQNIKNNIDESKKEYKLKYRKANSNINNDIIINSSQDKTLKETASESKVFSDNPIEI